MLATPKLGKFRDNLVLLNLSQLSVQMIMLLLAYFYEI